MKKGIGITIIIVVILALGGFAYGNIFQPESQQSTSLNIPDGATEVTFYNNGNSWVHNVVVFENTPKKDGTTGNIYADIWLKPKENGIPGTASIDISKLAGYGNKPLPTGTKITMNTWGNLFGLKSGAIDTLKLQIGLNTVDSDSKINTIEKTNLYVLPLPQGITDNKQKTTEDPSAGGEFLSNLISSGDSSVALPGTTITWNDARSLNVNGVGVVSAAVVEDPVLCNAAAGGEEETVPSISAITVPMQETGLPAVAALLSIFMIVGGLLYKKIK